MFVIINADDLGQSTHCSETIFDLMGKGRLTSATIMANCAGTEDALRGARRFPTISFGVHLNATSSAPIQANAALAPLLDREGRFTRKILQIKITRPLRRALYDEFCLQIERVFQGGVTVSHLDSHHHIHNLPRMFPVLKAVQRRYRIRKVRISQNMYPPGGATAKLLFKKRLYNWALRNIYPTRTTEGFTSLNIFSQIALSGTPHLKTLELMVHPGPSEYDEETRLLASGWLEQIPGGIKKITYREL